MNPTEDHQTHRDDARLAAALREYHAGRNAGHPPNRQAFLARYADIADELADCLAGLELVCSAASRLVPPADPPQPDRVLGDFRLLREIARGGMGIVYEAEQISLGRRVALKMLPLGATFDARQMQRFENEARAAAHLHHGNIVPVFAVGRDRGAPYYAMQLIEGRSLAGVIDDLRQAPARATPAAETAVNAGSLTQQSAGSRGFFRAVARAGLQAAQALEYAHQMGVVHRDIKPANLLLDGRGHLWVTDFGLARFQHAPGVTAPGDLIGTLRYMSPEQASGKPVVDPRTDVYGLGVTLYEVLALRPAVDGTDRQDCFFQILMDDPPPPRRLNRAVPAELETIVLKAMAKSPDDRYGSAGEMAADLERFLEDRPILARPPGPWDRAVKWARRHHRAVAAVMLGLAAAVVVMGITTWRVAAAEARTQAAFQGLQQEQRKTRSAYEALQKEQKRTAAALQEEAAQHARAEMNFHKAREVLQFLDRLGVDGMAGKPELQPLRRQLLAKLIDYYQWFIDHHRDAPEGKDELVSAQLQVSELLVEVGRKADALAAFEYVMRAPPRFVRERPGPPRGIARLFLLGQPAVQRELKLSADQVGRVNALLDFGPRPPSNEEATAAEKGLTEVLSGGQAARLEQIIRQMGGPHVLLDSEVVQQLSLTSRQREKIAAALERFRFGPGWQRGPPRPGDVKKAETEALAALQPEQRAGWLALQGKPFRGPFTMNPPPRLAPARGKTAYAYYEGDWFKLPRFDRLTPIATGVGPAFDLSPARRPERYGFRFEGFFRLEREEECRLTLASDDGSRLMIDGEVVVTNDGLHPARTVERRVKLTQGTHQVVVDLFQATADVALVVEIHTPTLGRRKLGDLVAPTREEAGRPRGGSPLSP